MATNSSNKEINIDINVHDDQVNQSGEKFVSLRRQIRETMVELQALTDAGDTQGKKFTELNLKLAELRTEQEQVNNKTQSLTATFGLLGGEVGEFSDRAEMGIQALKTISSFTFQDIKNQFMVVGQELKTFVGKIVDATGITKAYAAMNGLLAESFIAVGASEETAAFGAEVFSKAIVATGIGALIVGLVAVYQNWEKIENAINGTTEAEKEYNEVSKKAAENSAAQLATLESLGKLMESGTADQYQKNEAVNQYNKTLGDTLGKVKSWAELEDKLKEKLPDYIKYLQLKAQADAAYQLSLEATKEKIKEAALPPEQAATAWNKFVEGLGSFVEGSNYAKGLKTAGENNKKELVKSFGEQSETYFNLFNDFKKQADDAAKKLGIGPTAISYTGDTKNTKEDPRIKQAQAVQAELDKIAEQTYANTLDARDKELYVEGEKYNDLLEKAKKYGLDTTALTEAYHTQVNLINKKYDDQEDQRQEKRRHDVEQFEVKLAADLQKIEDKKQADKIKDYDDEIKLLQSRQQNTLKGTDAYFKLTEEIEQKSYEEKKLKAKDNVKALQDIEEEHKNNTIKIAEDERKAKLNINLQALDDIATLAGKESDIGKAALIAKQLLLAQELAMEISKTITFSAQAAARSAVAVAEGTAQTAKVGFPQNIPLLLAYAVQAAAIISAITSAVNGAKGAASNTTTSTAVPQSTAGKKGYADGGMIEGPSHAYGGVNINAQGGEAVMTRGAVSMFGPMLSMMNQMGGGTSFTKGALGQARMDAPALKQPDQQQPIIKTYVVSHELTTESHKQARLKDLSTL